MISRRETLCGLGVAAVVPSCRVRDERTAVEAAAVRNKPYETGRIEVFDSEFSSLISPDTTINLLADGFRWTEGPAWDSKREQLYFSDIPANLIYRWNPRNGLSVFANPAGRPKKPIDEFTEAGTNGILYLADQDALLICNQNEHTIDRLDLANGERKPVVAEFNGVSLNSPNDLVRTKAGVIYFTDPPFGMKDHIHFTGQSQPYNSVYRLTPDGAITLVSDQMTRPNGIGLSPDEATLYVSQSDNDARIIRAFELSDTGLPISSRVFHDFSDLVADDSPGNPDGMAVDQHGNLFASGPGGITVISAEGVRLGRIFTGRRTANCTFGEDGSTLFITAHETLLVLPTLTRGLA